MHRFVLLVVFLAIAQSSAGQLQITEVMYDPNSTEVNSTWEWIEIYNPGETDFDLDGYWLDDLGSAPGPETTTPGDMGAYPNIVGAGNTNPLYDDVPVRSLNTVVPSMGTAVVYNGSRLGAAETRFREAWNLDSSVRLIAADSFPSLNNSGGDAIGLWASQALQYADTDDTAGGTIDSFDNAVTSIDYRAGFPRGNGMSSIAYNGAGTISDGDNWSLSETGVNGAYQSTATFLPGSSSLNGNRNGESDIGNPGRVHGGTAPDSLLITEIMYDPASPDSEWEWMEVYNGTAATIDLSGYVLDDDDSGAIDSANVGGGTIDPGQTAVLFDADLAVEHMQAAWGADINFVAVTSWPSLGNSGDMLGLWPSYEAYMLDDDPESTQSPRRSFDNASADVVYDNVEPFPTDPAFEGQSSIYLTDLGAADANGTNTDGSVWEFSFADIDDLLSYEATLIPNETGDPDNSGMDIGSPGFNMPSTVIDNADFNGDGIVDAADYTVWRDNLGLTGGAMTSTGDANGDGNVDSTDYSIWRSQFGTSPSAALGQVSGAVPEPSTLLGVALLALAGVAIHRRRK